MKRILSILFAAGLLVWAGCDSTTVVSDTDPERDIAGKGSSVIPVPFAGTGNYYQAVTAPLTNWDQAREAAEGAGSYRGCTPHLLTVTSAEEGRFVFDTFQKGGPAGIGRFWLGGYQRTGNTYENPSEGWAWVTGEAFGPFDNWRNAANTGQPNEPNPEPNDDAGGRDENALQFAWGANDAGWMWNDVPHDEVIQPNPDDPDDDGSGNGYVIEWDCGNPVVARTSGSLQVHLPSGPALGLSFTATTKTDGSTDGRFSYQAHSGQWHSQGEILCLTVVGEEAWFVGMTTTSNIPGDVGVLTGFRVRDGGEGADAIDQAAFPIDLPNYRDGDLTAEDWCHLRPDDEQVKLRPTNGGSLIGNVQVR